MKKDDLNEDDFLRKLIIQISLDSPSDDFVDRVMSGIQAVPALQTEKRPFFYYINAFLPYGLLGLFLLLVISTSDLPFLNQIPGKEFLLNYLALYVDVLFDGFKSVFTNNYVFWGLLISISAGLLFLVDRIFSHHLSGQHHKMV